MRTQSSCCFFLVCSMLAARPSGPAVPGFLYRRHLNSAPPPHIPPSHDCRSHHRGVSQLLPRPPSCICRRW
uniref:Secreted protein n=1 Tax=Triticum urartu TaxID=4572 RepID=A0A8R7Q135_TRIUA